jgi:peptidoglycan/LPS O-acetylase OafA/YrhL
MVSYRADVDGLRAIAVLLVLVFHFALVPGGKAGFIGVDIFFVISGFLITSIITRELDAGAFRLGTFYLNRIRRLAPALFVALLLTLLAGALLLFPAEFDELARQALLAQTYVVNFYYWQSINYFGLHAANVLLLHTWSLAVEEQFYLLYPLALVLLHRYLKSYLFAALAAGLVLSFGLNVLFVADKPEATFYLLPTRAWELFAGGLIPFLNARWRRPRALDELIGVAGLGLVLCAVVFFSEEVRFPGFFALVPVGAAVCLLLSGSGSASAASRLLSLPAVVYVGKISYSLYLVHWPINVFARMQLGEDYSPAWRITMLCLSLALAAAIYHAIEDPVRRRQLLPAGRRLAQGYLAGLAASLGAFLLVHGTGGMPQRFPDDVVRIAAYVNDRTAALPECQYHGRSLGSEADFCRIGAPQASPRWLVYGDSHAWAAHSAFDKWLADKGEAGLFIFQHACPPLNGIHLLHDKGNCFAFNRAILGFLEKASAVRNVLIVSTWRQALEAGLSTSPDIKLVREESLGLFEERFSATLEHLARLGKRVYVWEPLPGARANVPVALARAARAQRPADIEHTHEQYISEYDFFFHALEKNRHLIAGSFSPSRALCASGRCAATIDGKPAYFDNSHITRSSAEFWVQVLRSAESN